MLDLRKNIDAYFQKMIELLSSAANDRISFLSKLAAKSSRKKFLTIEEVRSRFQTSIDRLLSNSKRAGILLFVDDIDRLPKDEYKKIHYLLKEFFNIYGFKIVVLKGNQRNHEQDEEEEFELQKFINLEYTFQSLYKSDTVQDPNFLKLMSITARSIQPAEEPQANKKVFYRFDKMLCDKTFLECMDDVFAGKHITKRI